VSESSASIICMSENSGADYAEIVVQIPGVGPTAGELAILLCKHLNRWYPKYTWVPNAAETEWEEPV
jgi:hypothetical protein